MLCVVAAVALEREVRVAETGRAGLEVRVAVAVSVTARFVASGTVSAVAVPRIGLRRRRAQRQAGGRARRSEYS